MRSALPIVAWMSAWLLAVAPIVAVAEVAGGAHTVIEARDLHADAGRVERDGVAILLMFSAQHCGYCARVREEFLLPMASGTAYAKKVIIRETRVDDPRPLRDFDSQPVLPRDLAWRYDVSLTPTILFLDGRGRELTKRIVGLGTPDFFGLYLDAAIDQARATLNSP